MNRKLHDEIGIVCLLPPATVTTTGASALVDLAGIDACEFIIRCEAVTGAGSCTPSIQACATTANSSFAAAASGDTVGDLAVIEADTDLVTQRAGYVGSENKRYSRVLLTVAGSWSAVVSVFAITGGARSEPAADPTAVVAT